MSAWAKTRDGMKPCKLKGSDDFWCEVANPRNLLAFSNLEFPAKRALFGLELLTQLPWRGKVKSLQSTRTYDSSPIQVSWERDSAHEMFHGWNWNPESSYLREKTGFWCCRYSWVSERKHSTHLRITRPSVFFGNAFKNYMKRLLFEGKPFNHCKLMKLPFLQTSLNTPGTHHCTPHLLPINPHWTWFLSPTVIGYRPWYYLLLMYNSSRLQQIKDVSTKPWTWGFLPYCWRMLVNKITGTCSPKKIALEGAKGSTDFAQKSWLVNVSTECRFNRGISSPIHIDT